MVTDLISEAFLADFHRFVERRGCPETLATDNGSNFVGAHKELRDFLYNFLNSTATQTLPARSPHFGRLWEAAIRSMKLLLFKTVKRHQLFEHIMYYFSKLLYIVAHSSLWTPVQQTVSKYLHLVIFLSAKLSKLFKLNCTWIKNQWFKALESLPKNSCRFLDSLVKIIPVQFTDIEQVASNEIISESRRFGTNQRH